MLRLLRCQLFACMVLACGPAPAQVLISQVYGGGGNSGAPWRHDYVELHNTGPNAVSLTGWTLQYASGTGNFNAGGSTALAGSILPGGFHLVRLASGGSAGADLPVAADSSGSANLSAGSGKLALVSGTGLLPGTCPLTEPALVDFVGYGSAGCSLSAPAAGPGNSLALQRRVLGCQHSGSNSADFEATTASPRHSGSAAQACGSAVGPVASCAPFAVVQGMAGSSGMSALDLSARVQSVSLEPGSAAGLTLGPLQAAAATGGTARVRLQAAATLAPGSHAFTLRWASDNGQQATCSASVSVQAPPAALSTIPALQGTGSTSPLEGSSHTVRGVVTAVLPGLRGWTLQDEAGDGDPLTSDGIFVFNGSQPIAVEAGERVQVTATVAEYAGQAGHPTVTELVGPSALAKLGQGSIAPLDVPWPEASEGDLERYEGMLVRLLGPLAVSQNFFQGRYGQVTLSAQGRLYKPTQQHRPGSPAALAMAQDNARRRIVLDDGAASESLFSGVENPSPVPYIGADNTLRAGDTAAEVVGVIDFGRITSGTGPDAVVDYKIHPTRPPLFERANPRPALPPAVGGTHRVASFNVLNWFTTFGNGSTASGGSAAGCLPGGTTADCRGADNLVEYQRQRDKLVRALATLDADVVALMEVQRNGGAAVVTLVQALNDHLGASVYAAVPDPAEGVGSDAIQMALIHKPARLSRVGAARSDLNPVHSRPPLAQTFQAASGERISVLVNHFKSKRCDDATGADLDAGDGQGCFNERRVQQAQALRAFVASVQASGGTPRVLVLGDLNAYAQEDPVHALTSDGLLADQAVRFGPPSDAYSFVFDGEAGALDHALASAEAAARITGTAHWHINADEPAVIDYNTEFKPQDLYTASPWRASDHDPVLVGLDLAALQQAQAISFAAPGPQVALAGFVLQAQASSGLAVAFASLTPTVCQVQGEQASLVAAGTCTVLASQAGNAQYLAAASVQRSFVVLAAPQSIMFGTPAARLLGSPPFAPGAAASSGLPVLLTSLTPAVCSVQAGWVTLLAPGTCSLMAQQPGDDAWAAAVAVLQSLQVLPGTADSPADGDVPLPAWALLLLGGLLAGSLRQARVLR